jgi:hypothetical protein
MLLLSTVFVYAQGSYTFKVLANKGQNKVKKAGSSTTEALKTGATLNSGDELIVSQGAYIGLMHKTGRTVEVREPGTKRVAELAQKVTGTASTTASRYAQFIASKMSDENNSYAARMNATGATERATGGAEINVMLPSSVNFLGDTEIIEWAGPEGSDANTEYKVTIMNIFDEVIYEETVTGNTVAIDFSDPSMQNESGLYIFTVQKADDEDIKSGNIGIKRASAEDNAEIVQNYEQLKSEVSEDSPLNKLIYASFFEENGMLLDAMTKYQEAMQMSPDVEDFQELYERFLIKNGLTK